jgi:hypothetical protein
MGLPSAWQALLTALVFLKGDFLPRRLDLFITEEVGFGFVRPLFDANGKAFAMLMLVSLQNRVLFFG